MALKVELVTVPPGKLNPHPKNSRKHNPAQISAIQASIRRFGIVKPPVVDAKYTILAGHGLVEAILAEGLGETPALRISGLTDAQKRAYLIADNRLAEKSTWDWDLLAFELSDLAPVVSLADIGFPEWNPETHTLSKRTKTGEIDPDDLETTHTCPACGFEF